MVNLNKCKLGDKLKMRNGKMAIYVGRDPCCSSHVLLINSKKFGYGMFYVPYNVVMLNHTERCYDIIGKWKDDDDTTF